MKTQVFRRLFFLSFWLVCTGAVPLPAAETTAGVRVDARVELCAVMCRLANYKEYQTHGIATYDSAVEEHFRPFTNHPVIAVMRKLHARHGIGYNAPMGLALVADPETFQSRVKLDPIPSWLDQRWTASAAKEFLAAMAQFAKDTKAQEFFAGQTNIHHLVEAHLSETLLPRLDLAWFAEQYGPMTNTSFCIIPGLLDGPQNYGVEVRLSDGRREIYGVIATPVFADGQPIKYPSEAMLQLLVHEFSHSFVNPWVDAHGRQFEPPAQKIFKVVATEMKAQAYGTARVMLYESLVRANTIRYFDDHSDAANMAKCIAIDQRKSFYWTADLARVLKTDTGSASSRLEASLDAVKEFFVLWGRNPEVLIGGAKARAKAAVQN